MLFVWSGWGGLAVGIPMLGFIVGMGVSGANFVVAGIGLAVGAVGAYLLGVRLNRTRPSERLAAFVEHRTMQLHSCADEGTFHLGPGHQAPASLQEAHAQADYLVDAEARDVSTRLFDRHTFFFVPMQYVAIGVGGLGLVLAVSTLVSQARPA